MPETALSRVAPDNMLLSFVTNAMGPALVVQQFAPLLEAARSQPGGGDPLRPAVIANISARVGSIGDNSLGGWYSYRCVLSMSATCLKHFMLDELSHPLAYFAFFPNALDPEIQDSV
jgi:NAD(P)-dependent dehydrogenase (short-subunit alcohol dehydrogenase family)